MKKNLDSRLRELERESRRCLVCEQVQRSFEALIAHIETAHQ